MYGKLRVFFRGASFLVVTVMVISLCASYFVTASNAVETEPRYKVNSKYAENAGRKMQSKLAPAVFALESETDCKEGKRMILGDVNMNNMLNTGDASLVLKHCNDMAVFDSTQQLLGDANENGFINTGDVIVVLRMCLGLIELKYIDITSPITKYTVTYSSGIEGQAITVPESESVEEGVEYHISAYEPTCSTYAMKGWRADFNGELYSVNSTFTMPSQNVKLTAEWEKLQGSELRYNIVDSFNGETLSDGVLRFEESVTLTNADFTIPNGYKFYVPDMQYKIIVDNNGIYPSSITVEVYPYVLEDNVEYVVICNAKGVDNMRKQCSWNYMLKNDIDMGSIKLFVPIGWGDVDEEITNFTGILNGDGHEISNLCCDYWDVAPLYACYVGLIAINEGTIMNLTVVARMADDSPGSYGIFGYRCVGMICGENAIGGTVKNCMAQGNVGSSDTDNALMGTAGGIAGANNGVLYRCGANVGAEGFYYIGGLCGKTFTSVSECWFVGAINTLTGYDVLDYFGVRNIGGLCGGAAGTITDCYSLLLDLVCAYGAVGGICGQAYGCTINNIYVAFSSRLYATSGIYIGTVAGFPSTSHPPVLINTYVFDSTTALPTTFDPQIWDMSGLSFVNLPDLTYIRRPEA